MCYSFHGVQSDSAATVVQTAGGVGVYVYEAHEARPMRPMYATLYSYPSRVSPKINRVFTSNSYGTRGYCSWLERGRGPAAM
jgi:hypothetical protein